MSSLILKSPAKVNLYLKILNRREDGFHNICTIFERINLCDTLEFFPLPDKKILIECDHPHVPTGKKNLVYKVAQLIQQEYGVEAGVKIRINKRIPVAAGLAGGSSNAATTLQGLNQFWKLGLKQDELLRLARKIGSDVAFFLYNCSWAMGTDRGDRIRPLNIKTRLAHILVVPKVKMYAWEVYGALRLSPGQKFESNSIESQLNITGSNKSAAQNFELTKKSTNVNILLRHLRKNNIIKLGQLMSNDLEMPVLKLRPALLKLKQKLNLLNAQGVMVSGSGPCVYGLTTDLRSAQQIQKIVARRYRQVFAVETL